MPHHEGKDPEYAPADESRERPEQAVTDNTSKTGGTGNPIGDTAIRPSPLASRILPARRSTRGTRSTRG